MLNFNCNEKDEEKKSKLTLLSKIFEAYITSDYANDAEERTEALVLFKDIGKSL